MAWLVCCSDNSLDVEAREDSECHVDGLITSWELEGLGSQFRVQGLELRVSRTSAVIRLTQKFYLYSSQSQSSLPKLKARNLPAH